MNDLAGEVNALFNCDGFKCLQKRDIHVAQIYVDVCLVSPQYTTSSQAFSVKAFW